MYNKFFNLRENPFNVNPDPRYLFFTPSALEALASLTYGIQTRKGIVLLTGEVGTGKTTLLNKLLDWLHERQAATSFIFNTQLSVSDLFDCLMADFGIPLQSRTKGEMLLRLNRWLLDRHEVGQLAVLVVDEAQNLSQQALEEIQCSRISRPQARNCFKLFCPASQSSRRNLDIPSCDSFGNGLPCAAGQASYRRRKLVVTSWSDFTLPERTANQSFLRKPSKASATMPAESRA